MPDYSWPPMDQRRVMGKRISRLDGPAKSSGAAKYNSDVQAGRHAVRGPADLAARARQDHQHRHQRSQEIAGRHGGSRHRRARKRDSVGRRRNRRRRRRNRRNRQRRGSQDQSRYEVLPHVVREEDLPRSAIAPSPRASRSPAIPTRPSRKPTRSPKATTAFPVITHCCLEPHGQTIQWKGDKIEYWPSTQNVYGIGRRYRHGLERARRQHPRPHGLHGRRIRQQIPRRSVGRRSAPSFRKTAAAIP